MTTPAPPKYVTLEELCSVLYVKPATVRTWAKKNMLPADAVLKMGRTHRYDVEMILASMRSPANTSGIPFATNQNIDGDDK